MFNMVPANGKIYKWANYDLIANFVNIDSSRFDIFGFQNSFEFLSLKQNEFMDF